MRTLLAVVIALAPAAATLADPGTVDWQRKVVRCSGTGAPNLRDAQNNVAVARIGAERAAKLDALRNCLEAAKGVRISGNDTVGGAISGDGALRARVEGAVKGFKVVDKPRYFSDGGVEMDVEVPLDGVGEAVLPPPRAAPAAAPGAPAGPGATGLLVDARGTTLLPALAPRLVDDNGLELYSASMVEASVRKTSGAVAWAKDPESAKKDLGERLGDRPLLVKVARAQGSDAVLADADAAALKGAPAVVLAEGRVVILTDAGGIR